MRLYYMTAERFALLILRERRLKISTIRELNDPFELLGASLGEKDMRHAMKILHEHWSRELGMICLTDDWQSPVMWAHYADKHYGVCLGFDVSGPPGLINQVHYVPDRLRDLLDQKESLMGIDEGIIRKILTTKFRDWAYEREYRLFAELKDRDPNGLYYLEFGPAIVLREVIIGSRCSLDVNAIGGEIKDPPQSVEVFKVRPAFDSFRIVRQQQVKPLIVESSDQH